MASLVFKTTSGHTNTEVAVVRVGGHSSRLATALTSGTTASSLAVSSLPYNVANGDNLALVSGTRYTVVQAGAAATASTGATTITVSFTPSSAWPVGTLVRDLAWPGAEREYWFDKGIAKDVPAEDYGMVAAHLSVWPNSAVSAGDKEMVAGPAQKPQRASRSSK